MGHFEDRLTAAYQRRMAWYPMNGVLLSDAIPTREGSVQEGEQPPDPAPRGRAGEGVTTPSPAAYRQEGSMTTPTTPTGKRLRHVLGSGYEPDILAIEQEAAAAERERLRAKARLGDEMAWLGTSSRTRHYLTMLLADPEPRP